MEYEDESKCKDDEDKMLDELSAQGVHENMSFFAFTATPKIRPYRCLVGKMKMENSIRVTSIL